MKPFFKNIGIGLMLGVGVMLPAYAELILPAPLSSSFSLDLQWQIQTGQRNPTDYLLLKPTYFHDYLYTVDAKGIVSAWNIFSGEKIWRQRLDVPVNSSPIASKKNIFLGTADGELIALSTQDGTIKWRKQLAGEVLSAPVLTHGQVFIKTENDELYSFERDKGHLQWVYQAGVPSVSLRIGSSPAVSDSLVVAGFSKGEVVALDQETGRKEWAQAISLSPGTGIKQVNSINATPKIKDNKIYVLAYQSDLVALDLKTGRIFWKYPVSGFTDITLANDQIFLSDESGQVWAFSASSGMVLWRQTQLKGQSLTTPVVKDSVVFVSDHHGNIIQLSAQSGQILSRFQFRSGDIMASLFLLKDRLYLYTSDGELLCYQLSRS